MTISEVIEFLVSQGGISNAIALSSEYKLALASDDFEDMQDVLEHAHELLALYS